MNCLIPHRAFYSGTKNFSQYNYTITTNRNRQEKLEKLLNKKTGEARFSDNFYYDVRNRKWVDISLWNKLNSWGNPICYDSIQLKNAMKYNEPKFIALQTVRDFIGVYGYNVPNNVGQYVKNDINHVKIIRENNESDRKQKIKLIKRELKKEWYFLKQIYRNTCIFGDITNYKNFMESNTRSGPIFECMCDYHSRFN